MDDETMLAGLTLGLFRPAPASPRLYVKTNFGVGFSLSTTDSSTHFLFPLSPCCLAEVDAVGLSGRLSTCHACGGESSLVVHQARRSNIDGMVAAASAHLDPLRATYVAILMLQYLDTIMEVRFTLRPQETQALRTVFLAVGVL